MPYIDLFFEALHKTKQTDKTQFDHSAHEWWPHTQLPRGGSCRGPGPSACGWGLLCLQWLAGVPAPFCKATYPCSASSMSSLGFQRLMTCFCALPSKPQGARLNWVLSLLWKITCDSWILGVCWLCLDKDGLGLIKTVLPKHVLLGAKKRRFSFIRFLKGTLSWFFFSPS